MAKRSNPTGREVYQAGFGHNSGETFFDLKHLLSLARVEHWDIDKLRKPIRVLRRHEQRKIAALCRSITTFGIFTPIIADRTGSVLSGVARLECAIQLGLTKVPVMVVAHLTDAEKRLFAVADNRIQELSTWDMPVLRLEMHDLSLNLDLDLTITGFDTPHIDRIIAGEETRDDPNDDLLPSFEPQPVSRLGDQWLLGAHSIYCGSAIDVASYRVLLENERAQMVITDPPYNVAIAGHARNSSTKHREFLQGSGEFSEKEFVQDFLHPLFKCIKSVSVDGAIIYVFIDHTHSIELQAAAYSFFGKQKNLCVWVKTSAGMGSFYRSQHELVYIFKNGSAPHINNFNLGEHGRHRTNVWNYPGANTSHDRREALDIHPTVKPCAMFVDAILDCSNRGGLVLDCFGGSGVTIIAAERTGRRARVIELDPVYVDLTVRRWQALTGKSAIHAQNGTRFDDLIPSRLGGTA